MRKSNKKDRLQPQLSHKIQSKLLISKQTSILSSKILSKIDHIRQQEDLQREYNQKFMTDRKKNLSTQKSQKSISSSKVTHKEPHKQNINSIVPQRLIFESEDFRQKYYELHDEYIELRRKDVENSQKIFHVKQSLTNFVNSPDSRGVQEISKLLESDKIKQTLRRVVEQRRKTDASQSILKEVMRILQVQSWEEILLNLRSRVQRFRTLDQCTFKILELESINKKVVSEFQERLRCIRLDQEEAWQRQRQMLSGNIQNLKKGKKCCEQECFSLKQQLQNVIVDLNQLTNIDKPPRIISNRLQIIQVSRVIEKLKNKLQEIELQAKDNMYKLVKSNEEMLKFERNIEHLRGEMQEQIQELQSKNEQNIFEIAHLQAQIEERQEKIIYYQRQIQKADQKLQRIVRQIEDQRSLLAATLGLEESHSAKIILKIKEQIEKMKMQEQMINDLNAKMHDKDGLNNDLKAQNNRISKALQQVQQKSKTAIYEKEEYKFLLNNLRDQVGEMRKQHSEQKARIIKQKDEQIVRSNKDILQSHSALNDQFTKIKSEYIQIKVQLEQTSANYLSIKNKHQSMEKVLAEKEGIINKLSADCDKYKQQLRDIENSFQQVVELQQISTRKATALSIEYEQVSKNLAAIKQSNNRLQKSNSELIQERNTLKTEVSQLSNDLKQLKEYRNKLQATNVQLRLDNLNKQSQTGKLEEKLKLSQNQLAIVKKGNQKLMNEVNLVTRKFISYKNQIKRKFTLKTKSLFCVMNQIREQISTLQLFIKTSFISIASALSTAFGLILQQVQKHLFICNIYQPKSIQKSQYSSQCSILPSDIKQHFLLQLTQVLTMVSLLRTQKHQIEQELKVLNSFDFYQSFKYRVEGVDPMKLRELQGSIEMIKEETYQQQQSDLINTAKIIGPQQIFCRDGDEVNLVLQSLLEGDNQIPSLHYWQKIQTNFLAIRRKLAKKTNLKLDISAIDHRDPSINSPLSSSHYENELFKKMATDTDQLFESNRSDRLAYMAESLKKQNQQLKVREEQLTKRLKQLHDQMLQLRGQLIKIQNQTSIVGIQMNFKKLLDYILTDNVDSFMQACRVIMKMMHYTDLEMNDFEVKVQAKRKKKKGNFFTEFFKN